MESCVEFSSCVELSSLLRVEVGNDCFSIASQLLIESVRGRVA